MDGIAWSSTETNCARRSAAILDLAQRIVPITSGVLRWPGQWQRQDLLLLLR